MSNKVSVTHVFLGFRQSRVENVQILNGDCGRHVIFYGGAFTRVSETTHTSWRDGRPRSWWIRLDAAGRHRKLATGKAHSRNECLIAFKHIETKTRAPSTRTTVFIGIITISPPPCTQTITRVVYRVAHNFIRNVDCQLSTYDPRPKEFQRKIYARASLPR